MNYTKALVRLPGEKVFQTEESIKNLGPVDIKLLNEQHKAYSNLLQKAGLELIVLEPDFNYPDGIFVEDAAVIAGNTAVITRLKRKDRRGEEAAIEKVLKEYKNIKKIKDPATFEGGDVMKINNLFYVGFSERTNMEGIKQFYYSIEKKFGVCPIDVKSKKLMHLKCAASYAGNRTLLLREDLANIKEFQGRDIISVPKKEEYFTNVVSLENNIIMAKGSEYVSSELKKRNFNVYELDFSEIKKLDGSPTCISILF